MVVKRAESMKQIWNSCQNITEDEEILVGQYRSGIDTRGMDDRQVLAAIKSIPFYVDTESSFFRNPRDTQMGLDLRLMSWGDGSEVPTTGNNLVIVGTDNNGLLHVRIFDTGGYRIRDTDETTLAPTQLEVISALKQQVRELSPPHVLTEGEKDQLINDATSIVGRIPQPPLPFAQVETTMSFHHPEEIIALMTSMILGVWTAFEVLAGDLWEAALNAHPQGLAELKGNMNGNKHNKNRGTAPANDSYERRTEKIEVSLSHIRDLEFSTAGKMGTLLRNVVKFDSVRGICESYRSAFWEDDESIEEALDYYELRRLNLVRNLLVHKAGKADKPFLEEAAKYPDLSACKIGDTLVVDGEMVLRLVEPVIGRSKDLIQAVNQWIEQH
jgi:hypothetical protein